MPVALQDIRAYGSALDPIDDVLTCGGTCSLVKMMDFTDPAGNVQIVASDAAEIGFAQWLTSGLDAAGGFIELNEQPNGLSPQVISIDIVQLLRCWASTSGQVADVAIEGQTALDEDTAQEGGPTRIRLAAGAPDVGRGVVVRLTGGTGANQIRKGIEWNNTTKDLEVDRPWDTEPDNTTTYRVAQGMVLQEEAPDGDPIVRMRKLFYRAEGRRAGQGAKVYYDKFFFRNDHLSDSIANCVVSMVDPTGKVRFGLASAINDSDTTTNRLTAPAGVTFGTSPAAVPGGTLGPEEFIGVWVELTRDEEDPEIVNAQLEFAMTGDE